MYWKFRIPWGTLLSQSLILTTVIWVGLFQWNFKYWLAHGISMNSNISLLLKRDLTETHYEHLLTALRHDFPELTIQEPNAQQILDYLHQQLGDSSEFIQSMKTDHLPQILDLRLREPSLKEWDALLQQLEQRREIDQIIHAKPLLKMLDWWYHLAQSSLWGWGFILFLMVLEALNGMIRQEMVTRHEEMELLRFAGVSFKNIFLEYLKEGYTLLSFLMIFSLGAAYFGYRSLVEWGYLGKYLPFPGQTLIFFDVWDLSRGGIVLYGLGAAMIFWKLQRSEVR